MNKEMYMQFIASFMVSLVLSIPFITGASASIDNIVVKGSDGIEGFARTSDFLDFSVSVTYANMTPAKLFLGTQTKFDKCSTAKDNATVCTLKYPKTGKQSFESRPLPFTINLYKDEAKSQIISSEKGNIFVDNMAPQAKLSIAKSIYSAQEGIEVNYEANDFSCNSPECNGQCAGFKSIEIRTADNSFRQSINPNTTDCNVKSSLIIEAGKVKDGGNSLTITAADKFNQVSSNQSVSFSIDAVPPKILAETFKILRKGIALSTYSNKNVPVEVSIDIQAADLNVNSVIADFTPLNPTKELKNLKGVCTSIKADTFRCKWAIDINAGISADQGDAPADDNTKQSTASTTTASKTASKPVNITASDKTGNIAITPISKSLSLDDKGPAIQSLTAGIEKEGKFYAKSSRNTVTAIFSEATGMAADETFLHVDGKRIAAASCKKDSNWVCKWQNVDFGNSGKSVLSVKSDTVDLLLNPVAEEKSIEIIIDSNAPVVKGIGFVSVSSLSKELPELFKIGDKISIEANVTEENDLAASVDLSRFVEGAKNVAGSCQRLEDKSYRCLWTSEAITKSGVLSMKFNFSDLVGNSISPEKQLKVLELDEAAPPDYWKNNVKCSPQAIDRQLGPFINQRLYCQVKLEPNRLAENPSILSISDATCTGSQLIEKYETFNNEFGSRTPIIKFILKKDEFKIDEAKITCTFNIVSRRGDIVTKNPETEKAEIIVKFYNQPLGEISEEVEKKIKDAKEDAQGIWKKIGTWNKIINYAKKICQFINTIYLAATAFYTLTSLLQKAETATPPPFDVPVKTAALKSCLSSEGINNKADSFKKVTNKFCDYVTCKQTILWGNAAKNFIDNLPLGRAIGPTTAEQEEARKQGSAGTEYDYLRDKILGQKPLSEYIDYRNNLMAATLFACIPGIIAGLEKYRQINCLYADCLQTSVAQEGLPITACEDLKKHATCKYIYGEVFAVIPYTAFFDHFTSIIKESLSNPFTALSLSASVYCTYFCVPKKDAGIGYQTCRGFRLFSLLGDTADNVRNLVNEGFKVRQDYCERLDIKKEEVKEGEDKKKDDKKQND